jgi:hypothetical protein
VALLVYSIIFVYLRYSSDGQADGLSFERQRAAAESYLASIGIDKNAPEVVWVEDPGFSAFHGEHLRAGQLGKIVAQVRSRKVTGGMLVCETVSRASRQGSFALLPLIQDFLNADFTIKLLDGPEAFNRNNVPKFLGTMLALQADLAHAESLAKSEYSIANWAKRREQARTNGTAFTSECPRWLRVVDDNYVPIRECVESVVKVFQLALNGWGVTRIVSYANKNSWVAPAKKPGWHLSLVNRLLQNKALLGEFQPYQRVNGKRVPLGDPIAEYYPAVIDADLFYAVQGIRSKAAQFPRRRDENNYNYLLGLATCECGASWRRINKNSGKQAGYAVYACSNRVRHVTDCPYMPARKFDNVFVGAACEQIPALLATDGQSDIEKERLAIDAQLQDLHKRRESLVRFIEANADLEMELGDKLRSLVYERRELEARRAQLTVHEVPQDFSFGEAVAVFLPAFLDIYDANSPDGEAAFRSRALFRARLIEAVQAVEVARDRKSFTVKLKNGTQFTQSSALALLPLDAEDIEDIGYGASTDLTEDELAETRSEALAAIKRVGNVPKTAQ